MLCEVPDLLLLMEPPPRSRKRFLTPPVVLKPDFSLDALSMNKGGRCAFPIMALVIGRRSVREILFNKSDMVIQNVTISSFFPLSQVYDSLLCSWIIQFNGINAILPCL